MKKFFVIIAVLALTMQGFLFSKPQPAEASEKLFPPVSAGAMAQMTFDGSIEFLMRSVKNVEDWNDASSSAVGTTPPVQDTYRNTYERVRFGINAKHDNVKGRIQIENDWDTWADNRTAASATAAASNNPGIETRPNGVLSFREAWLDFNIPGAPAFVKVGRQFLQLGNGWFFRSNKYGSDAWVVGMPGKNTVAFVNVKAAENDLNQSDDTDVYVLLDTFKIDDKNTVGAYIARLLDRKGDWLRNSGGVGATEMTLDTIGLHYSGVVGPVKLAAEVDLQMGEAKYGAVKEDFSGRQIVVQASLPVDALTVNATVAMGTGDDPNTANDDEGFYSFLDKDPHYTLVYEYFMRTAAGAKNTGFSNTTALSLGAMYKINKMFSVGADFWMFTADQKDNNNGGTDSDKVGNELDVKVNVTLYDQLTWNTTYGLFQPGKMYENAAGKADDASVIQSVLSYKF